jgi:hypothetical protein
VAHRIRLALDFLAWLDYHQQALGSVTQHDIDRWLSEGSTRRHDLRDFIVWATGRGLIGNVSVPARPIGVTVNFLSDEQRTTMLRRCVNDARVPLDVRVAGSLVLLFGVTINRIVHLTTDDVEHRDDGTYARLGDWPALLPPRLADLIQRLAETRWALPSGPRSGRRSRRAGTCSLAAPWSARRCVRIHEEAQQPRHHHPGRT